MMTHPNNINNSSLFTMSNEENCENLDSPMKSRIPHQETREKQHTQSNVHYMVDLMDFLLKVVVFNK